MNPLRNIVSFLYNLLIERRSSGSLRVYFASFFDFSFFLKRIRAGKAKDFPLAKDIDLRLIRYTIEPFKPGITPDYIFPHSPYQKMRFFQR